MGKCNHENVICRRQTLYHIPEGWDKLQKQEHIDMEDYRNGKIQTVWICQDCSKILYEI